MSDYVIPLICVNGMVSNADGTPITPEEIRGWVSNQTDVSIENDESEDYWPDIVFTNRAIAPTIKLAGINMTGELILGSHPHRPKIA